MIKYVLINVLKYLWIKKNKIYTNAKTNVLMPIKLPSMIKININV